MESNKMNLRPDTDRAAKPLAHSDWLRAQIEKEPYWFHRIELAPGLVTPGWSEPKKEKLPHFGLPDDMRGMRVLDIGCAEGFFLSRRNGMERAK